MTPPRASAATMAANPNPTDAVDHIPAGGDNGASPGAVAEAPPPRRRGRRPTAAAVPAASSTPAVELTEAELAAIGVLTVRAARAGVAFDAYVDELRELVQAYDRMQASIAK